MHLSVVALKLLTNLSVLCSLASNRVKAKSASTLGEFVGCADLNKSAKQFAFLRIQFGGVLKRFAI